MIRDVAALPSGHVPPLPFRLGANLSTPIVLSAGSTYGTLCCFSAAPNEALQNDGLDTLRQAAQLVARRLELAQARR